MPITEPTLTDLHATSDSDDHGHDDYSTAMIYGYGTASVAIISCLSLLGILLFPSLKNRSHEYFMQFLIGLGVGTMTADALIHIIPQVLGLHGHAHEEEGHSEEDHSDHDHSDHDHSDEHSDDIEAEYRLIVWKMSVVYAGIYVLFALENGFKAWKRHRSIRQVDHDESIQDNDKISINGYGPAQVHDNKAYSGSVDGIKTGLDNAVAVDEMTGQREDKLFWGFNTVQLAVFLGDVLHNVADGLAIGVSFAESATAGIGTSIAVLCHEIPHEFGDFAIYMKNDASKWRAILLNLGAACTAFIGLYIGIAAASQNEAARQWMLAVIAGMFIYIALVQVLVEMVRPVPIHAGVQFLLQNSGLILGWVLMLLLGLYEESIEESFA